MPPRTKGQQARPKHHELTLPGNGQLFHASFEQAPVGMAFIALDGRILRVNERLCEFFGYTQEELQQRTIGGIAHADDVERLMANFPRIVSGEGKRFMIEERFLHKDGTTAWGRVRASAIFDPAGRPRWIIVVIGDITSQKRAEEALRARVRQQAAVAELGRRALSESDLHELMQDAARLVAETLNVEFSKIMEVRPERDELVVSAGFGWRPGIVGHAHVPARGGSQAGHNLETGKPFISHDLRKETAFRVPAFLHEHAVISTVSVLVKSPDGPFGTLEADSASPREFTSDDIHFLDAVANVISLAMERQRDEAEIREQQIAIRQLSTPVLRLRDRLLILPLIGSIDEERATQLVDQLLHRVRDERARAVVMDVTGVPRLDSRAASYLIRAIEAARLMGATVILTGLSKEVTTALVDLQIDFSSIPIATDLQAGIEQAVQLLGYRLATVHSAA